jgi:hypothetical protein
MPDCQGTLNNAVTGVFVSRAEMALLGPIDKGPTPSYLSCNTSQACPAGLFTLPALQGPKRAVLTARWVAQAAPLKVWNQKDLSAC